MELFIRNCGSSTVGVVKEEIQVLIISKEVQVLDFCI